MRKKSNGILSLTQMCGILMPMLGFLLVVVAYPNPIGLMYGGIMIGATYMEIAYLYKKLNEAQ
jgi:hypothetical protein